MAHIRLADLVKEPTTVEVFDQTYTVLPITRSVQKKLEKIDVELKASEDDSDKIVAILAAGIDALLTPQGESPRVGEALVDAWKTDRLSLNQLNGLFEDVQEASVARPT